MTTLHFEKLRCAVCGTEFEYTGIGSTSSFGLPDLDTRPPEMQRSTIFSWVQRCPECGYCSSDVQQAYPSAKQIIYCPEYIKQLNDENFYELANSFLCKAFIEDALGDYGVEAWTLIHAAWACDDDGNEVSARKCRVKALEIIARTIEHGQLFVVKDGLDTAIKVDLMRRSGLITEAKELILEKSGSITDDIISQILAYQDALLAKGD